MPIDRFLRTAALAAGLFVCVTPAARAQTPHTLTINQAASSFTWSAVTSAGTVQGVPNNNFNLSGTVEMDLYATQPVQAASLEGSDAMVVPDLMGRIPNPLPFLPPLLTLQITNLHLSATSPVFPVSGVGIFTTDVTMEALSGVVSATVLGTAQPPTDLTGSLSDPTPVTGTVTRTGNLITLTAPINSVFNFVDPGTMTTVTVTLSGTVVASGAAIDETANRYCSGDGGDQLGCTNCPCGNNTMPGTIGGCLNGASTRAILGATGLASVSADTLRFQVVGANPSTFGVLTSGDNRAPNNPASPCFGLDSGIQSASLDGLRCVVGAVQRHGARSSDVAGDIGISTPGWGPPNGPAGGLIAQGGFTAGQTRHYQVIYRELPTLVCMTGQNTSDACSVTFVP